MNAKLFKIQYTIGNGTQSETITVQASDQNAARYVFQALMPGVRLISGTVSRITSVEGGPICLRSEARFVIRREGANPL